ncbi:MAG: hypothetical protein AB7S26_30715 [Sandaracinaceae bacterium]
MDNDDFDQRPAAVSLAALLVFAFEKAWHLSRRAARRIEPLVTPPPELRVTARGTLYSGVIILDRNEVIFGVVVATGYDPSGGAAPPFTSPSLSSTTSTALERLRREQAEANNLFGDRRGRLPGWAETGDDDDGGGTWRR